MMTEEIWKPIPGYDGWYEASSLGRIRSWKMRGRHGVGKRRPIPRIISPRVGTRGTLLVAISTPDNVVLTVNVHRLVLEAFTGSAPQGSRAEHIDGNVRNNLPSNIKWSRGGRDKGRVERGEALTWGSG